MLLTHFKSKIEDTKYGHPSKKTDDKAQDICIHKREGTTKNKNKKREDNKPPNLASHHGPSQ